MPVNNFEDFESALTSRSESLFSVDIRNREFELQNIIRTASFLVLGGAGSIGKSVVKEIVSRNPKKIHIADLNENGLAELTRDIRSSIGYFEGEFSTFVCDVGSELFEHYFLTEERFDYVLNFTALKHVRSEKDIISLARLIQVNIFNTKKVLDLCGQKKTAKYFCVSTDKASSPVNFMGASKRIMELFLANNNSTVDVSTARFANVAFSNGSLPHSMLKRIESRQPITIPKGIKRFFVSHKEAGELCLMSCLFGKEMEIFFPRLTEEQHSVDFLSVALDVLKKYGLKAEFCDTEQQAREYFNSSKMTDKYPLFLSDTDTSGEKPIEEFYTSRDKVCFTGYDQIGMIRPSYSVSDNKLAEFDRLFSDALMTIRYDKDFIRQEFQRLLPDFDHAETGKSLEDKM